MIEVTIRDTETNMEKVLNFSTPLLKRERAIRAEFFLRVNQMIGEFLRDLREQGKETKP